MAAKYPKERRVRCLGPKPEEHWFSSADPTTNRICPKCRWLLEQRIIGKLGTEPPMHWTNPSPMSGVDSGS